MRRLVPSPRTTSPRPIRPSRLARRHPARRRTLAALALVVLAAAACGGDSASDAPDARPRATADDSGLSTAIAEADAAQAPACQADGPVAAIADVGGVWHLGGSFRAVRPPAAPGDGTAGVARSGVAACDGETGAVLAWYPTDGADGPVHDLAADGPWLYVAGEFTMLGGVAVGGVSRVSAGDGDVDATWTPLLDGPARTILPTGDGVLVGGAFTEVDGVPRPGVVRIRPDGSVDPDFAVDLVGVTPTGGGDPVGPEVLALAVEGDSLYVAGVFGAANGRERHGVARVDLATGAAIDEFAPALADLDPDDGVVQVTDIVPDDRGVYLCGDWWISEGVGSADDQRNVGRFERDRGAVDRSWLPSIDDGVRACRLTGDGSALVIAGRFSTVGDRPRDHLAAISVDDPAAGPAMPRVGRGEAVAALALDGAGRVALGGAFDRVGDRDQESFAVLVP